MTNYMENAHTLFLNDKKKLNESKTNFYKRWWYQDYEHQHFICEIIEQKLFYKITILLLIFDCIFVITQTIIDFTKVKSECAQKTNSFTHKSKHEIEILMKTLHYMSISILTFFVFELCIKIYAFGRDFWNINKRKMEYLDGFIVILSYFIDIYCLINEKNYFMVYRIEMLTTIRMWRILRIINCVAQCVINEEQKKKDHLNAQYIITIEHFLDLLKSKSNFIENEHENRNEYFNQIDKQCQDYFDVYKESTQHITSSTAITEFAEQLETLKVSVCKLEFSILIKE